MQITLFKNNQRSLGKYHIEHPGVMCFAASEISTFYIQRTIVFIDLEETKATGHLYIQLLNEDVSWYRDDEVCHKCSAALVKIIKQGREPREI